MNRMKQTSGRKIGFLIAATLPWIISAVLVMDFMRVAPHGLQDLLASSHLTSQGGVAIAANPPGSETASR
jgi:hypothetical protein